MDFFGELREYLTTYHPRLHLGDEKLKSIKLSTNSKTPKKNYNEAKTLRIKTHNSEVQAVKKQSSIPIDPLFPLTNIRPSKRQRDFMCPCCEKLFPSTLSEQELNVHLKSCKIKKRKNFKSYSY